MLVQPRPDIEVIVNCGDVGAKKNNGMLGDEIRSYEIRRRYNVENDF